MRSTLVFVAAMLLLCTISCGQTPAGAKQKTTRKISKTDAQWRKQLSPNQYQIMVEQGTEPAFHNAYWNNHKKGTYVSAATGEPLFSSETKFESGTGWPSFWAPIDSSKVEIRKDESFGMTREEVIEKSTGLHLGHVFDDGPKPTGKRYCMNSGALKFIPSK